MLIISYKDFYKYREIETRFCCIRPGFKEEEKIYYASKFRWRMQICCIGRTDFIYFTEDGDEEAAKSWLKF